MIGHKLPSICPDYAWVGERISLERERYMQVYSSVFLPLVGNLVKKLSYSLPLFVQSLRLLNSHPKHVIYEQKEDHTKSMVESLSRVCPEALEG